MHLTNGDPGLQRAAKQLRDRLAAGNRSLRKTVTLQQNLTSMVVHDMRGPIQCVSGYLDLLGRSSPRSRADEDLLRRADGCLRTLSELVTSLLDVSRLEAGKMPLHRADVSVTALARQAMATLVASPSQTQRVRLVGPEEEAVASVDAPVIRRVIANLVINALKYSPPGSDVELHVEEGPAAVHVDVQDHGPGIPRRYQGRIFEKFAQIGLEREERPNGAGLGLTFCKLAVEAHGGHLGLESDEGSGSRFWFDLPVHGPPGAMAVA
jgi:signal transduction histidine kinase